MVEKLGEIWFGLFGGRLCKEGGGRRWVELRRVGGMRGVEDRKLCAEGGGWLEKSVEGGGV
jgi:hypothetical protein